MILGSSPIIEGIPAFFAAGKYGAGLIAAMALCVTSVTGLQRMSLGPLERYGEVLSGTFIALVGVTFLVFPVL